MIRFLLLLLLRSGVTALVERVPSIVPNVTHMYLNEGDELKFSCIHTREVHVIFPTSDAFTRSKTSPHKLFNKKRKGTLVRKKFKRAKTVFGDTGLYGCTDVLSTKTMSSKYDLIDTDGYSRLIYVYVSSNKSAFTETKNNFRTIYKNPGDFDVTLPCRPTNPGMNITVFDEETKQTVPDKNVILADREKGVTVSSNSSNLSCRAQLNGLNYSIAYQISKLSEKFNTKINSFTLYYYGNSLNSQRRRKLQAHTQFKFKKFLAIWGVVKTQEDDNVTIYSSWPKISNSNKSANQRKNVYGSESLGFGVFTSEDIGMYRFTLLTSQGILKANVYINGYAGPLSVADDRIDAQLVEGDNIDIQCKTEDKQNNTRLEWLNAETMEPVFSEDSEPRSELTIKFRNVSIENGVQLVCRLLQADEVHNYTVVSEFYYDLMIEKRVKLQFIETNLNNSMSVYENQTLLEEVTLVCHAQGVPEVTKVTWRKDGIQVINRKVPYNDLNVGSQVLTVKSLPDKVSNYSCLVTNRFNETLEAYQILARSDRVKTHFQHTTNLKNETKKVEERSSVNVTLKCHADGEPKPTITWYKDEVPLKFTGKVNSSTSEELFVANTNEQKLLVKSLPTNKNQVKYSCKANNHYGEEIEMHQLLYIDPPSTGNSFWILPTVGLVIFGSPICYIIFHQFREHKIKRKYLKEVGLLQLNSELQLNPREFIYDQVDKLPYDKKWEFNIKRLKLGEKLGSGTFGVVIKAEAYGICPGEEVTAVAVKMVHPHADFAQVRALASELKVMIYIGKHVNILNLFGACTDNISKRELFVIIEYCQHGNLHDYILRNRENFVDEQAATIHQDLNLNSTFCTQDLLSWSFQVARGMEYISEKKVLHGDLAARNILLAENNIVKICDFGLAKILYHDENYKKSNKGLLPIKWMSIESIRDQVFSTESDVWSYGIVLWEFFSLAEVPYCDINAARLLPKLLDGYRLKKPKHAPENLYDIMKCCWNKSPSSRPTFSDLVEKISSLMEAFVKSYYTNLCPSGTTSDIDESL